MEYINYIKPELLILIPILNGIGVIIKKSKITDSRIPAVLVAISIVLSCLWVIGNSDDNIFNALFIGIVQGLLCALVAVGGHQVFKQYRKDE